MALLDELALAVTAQVSGFVSGMDKATKSVKGFFDVTANISAKFNAITVAVQQAGRLLEDIKKPFTDIAQLARFADQIQTNVDEIQRLELIGSKAGLTLEEMVQKFGRFEARLGGAEDQTGATAKALESLGLSAQKLELETPTQKLGDIAEAISHLGTATQKITATQEIFGRGALGLVPILSQGRQAVEDLAKKSDALAPINEEQARNAQQLTRELNLMVTALSRVENQIVAAFLPAMLEFVKITKTAADGVADLLQKIFNPVPKESPLGIAPIGDLEKAAETRVVAAIQRQEALAKALEISRAEADRLAITIEKVGAEKGFPGIAIAVKEIEGRAARAGDKFVDLAKQAEKLKVAFKEEVTKDRRVFDPLAIPNAEHLVARRKKELEDLQKASTGSPEDLATIELATRLLGSARFELARLATDIFAARDRLKGFGADFAKAVAAAELSAASPAKEMQDLSEAIKKGAEIMKASQPPFEKFNAELKETQKIFEKRALSPEAFGRELGKISLAFAETGASTQDQAQKFSDAIQIVTRAVSKLRDAGKLTPAGLSKILQSLTEAELAGFEKITKAQEKADKARADIDKRAADRTKELRTPTEKFRDELKEINAEFEAGALKPEIMVKAISKARDEFVKAEEAARELDDKIKEIERGPGGAIQAGTTAAFSAIEQEIRGARAEAVKFQEEQEIAKKANDVFKEVFKEPVDPDKEKKIAEAIEKIIDHLAGIEKIGLPEILKTPEELKEVDNALARILDHLAGIEKIGPPQIAKSDEELKEVEASLDRILEKLAKGREAELIAPPRILGPEQERLGGPLAEEVLEQKLRDQRKEALDQQRQKIELEQDFLDIARQAARAEQQTLDLELKRIEAQREFQRGRDNRIPERIGPPVELIGPPAEQIAPPPQQFLQDDPVAGQLREIFKVSEKTQPEMVRLLQEIADNTSKTNEKLEASDTETIEFPTGSF